LGENVEKRVGALSVTGNGASTAEGFKQQGFISDGINKVTICVQSCL